MQEPEVEPFHCEVMESPSGTSKSVVQVYCYGRLVAGSTEPLRATVQPFINRGGSTVIDLSDVLFMDSMGLGALVAPKVSSVHKGFGTLEFVNLSPRVKELLRLTKLSEYLS